MKFRILLLRIEINSINLFIFSVLVRMILRYIIQAQALLGKNEIQQCLLPQPPKMLYKEEGTKVPRSQLSSRYKRMFHSPWGA